jgi:hypothetical protein
MRDVQAIAKVCHEVNRAYCLSMGDESATTWEDAPEWQTKSLLIGVELHLNNPVTTPEQSHNKWLETKTAEGWKYGPVKDVEKKEHPCYLPYSELPASQRAKDFIFAAIVKQLSILPAGQP